MANVICERSRLLQKLPFRRLLYNIFKSFNQEDFVKLKQVTQYRNLLPEEFPYSEFEHNEDTATICCEFLEAKEYVKATDVSTLYLLLTHVRKPQLIENVRQYEVDILGRKDETTLIESPRNIRNLHDFFTAMFEYCSRDYIHAWILKVMCLMLAFFVYRESNIGVQALLTVIAGNHISKLFVILVLVTIYVYFHDLKTYYRYLKVTHGCIHGSEMSFKFETTDYQHAHVKNNVEFHYSKLQTKFPDLLKHPDGRMHYFLNTNRSVNGGLRTVGSYLDKTPAIRGAAVFAVSADGESVWYFHHAYKAWMEYETAECIEWKRKRK